MDRRRGAIAVLLLKWIVVPAALMVVGYFLVGPFMPRILGSAPLKPRTPVVEEPATILPPEKTYAEPEVDVTATRTDRRRRDSQRRRTSTGTRRQPEAPVESPPEDDEPPVDVVPDDPPPDDPPPDDTGTTGTTGGDDGL